MRSFALKCSLILLTALGLGLPMTACKGGGGDSCPDVEIIAGCELRCKRTTNEGGQKKVCGKSLLLSGEGNNQILQRKTKRLETRQLPKETCYAVNEAGALTSADDKKALEAVCKSP